MTGRTTRGALALVVILALATVAGAWTAAGRLSAPVRRAVGPAPAGFADERIIHGSDTVAGWSARGTPGAGAVLLLHGVRGDRRSMLGRARLLHGAGYTVLLVDLPAHGESTGGGIAFGAREGGAARAAIARLRALAPGERTGAIGVSLGGASLLLGPEGPAAASLDAVVLEMVYPTIEEAIANRLRIRLGDAGVAMAPLLVAQLRPRLGVGAAELRPVDRIGALRAPLLVIAGERDPRTPLAESRRLFAAAREPKALWVVPRAGHEDLQAAAPAEYERRVLAFLAGALR